MLSLLSSWVLFQVDPWNDAGFFEFRKGFRMGLDEV
jgi:hypothetical protein